MKKGHGELEKFLGKKYAQTIASSGIGGSFYPEEDIVNAMDMLATMNKFHLSQQRSRMSNAAGIS